MCVHEKIRLLRRTQGWSQEEMAHKLEMSTNGYGSIERGDTDVSLSRLQQIASLFNVNVSELFDEIGSGEAESAFKPCPRCPLQDVESDKWNLLLREMHKIITSKGIYHR